jgi:uncharacterized membrane protein YkvA (DUF1232 family)
VTGNRRGAEHRLGTATIDDTRAPLDNEEAVQWEVAAGDRPTGGPRTGARRTVLGAIREIPHYLRLLWALARDPRVAIVDKLLVLAAAAYVVSPIDVIPDFIPFLGQIDDLYLVVLAMQRMVSRAGREVLADHWTGDPGSLSSINLGATLAAAAFFLPPSLRNRVRRALRG